MGFTLREEGGLSLLILFFLWEERNWIDNPFRHEVLRILEVGHFKGTLLDG